MDFPRDFQPLAPEVLTKVRNAAIAEAGASYVDDINRWGYQQLALSCNAILVTHGTKVETGSNR